MGGSGGKGEALPPEMHVGWESGGGSAAPSLPSEFMRDVRGRSPPTGAAQKAAVQKGLLQKDLMSKALICENPNFRKSRSPAIRILEDSDLPKSMCLEIRVGHMCRYADPQQNLKKPNPGGCLDRCKIDMLRSY